MSDTRFSVSGQWPFPYEMLTDDRAVPASKADADLISHLMQELDDDDPLAGVQSVTLLLRDANGRMPDEKEWAASGWPVISSMIW
jgi:hypothetical protein